MNNFFKSKITINHFKNYNEKNLINYIEKTSPFTNNITCVIGSLH